MQRLEGSGTPVLYIGRTVLKGETSTEGFFLWSLRTMHVSANMSYNFLNFSGFFTYHQN